ncbi:MAG: acetate--CoA ligase family protein [Gammaproteobacteria bacterium]|nr:acetate--CoA ligase family protein [Gammaproteobacteria bacterium]MYD75218.1 acetate--CoA ligase family protein [Gammaproteobacteria bacterium]
MGIPDRKRQGLKGLLKPDRIAFVGGAALEPAIAYTRALGFPGELCVINPGRDHLAGIPCCRSAQEVEGPIDLAFIAVPCETVIDAVDDLARAGAGAAIVNSSGFAETGENGRMLQNRLVEAARDMPFIGPNCPGIANFLDGVGGMLDNLGVFHFDRGVAVLSNGGAYLADISCSDRSIPISHILGMGNQACVSIAEMMQVILEDPRVTAINLYLESLVDVETLSENALEAYRRDIPVVVMKSGYSGSGARAARTHSASMSGDREVASALFRKLGFIEVASASEAIETLKMLTITGPLSGRRVALATSSGTYAVTGGDVAERHGLELPVLSHRARTALKPLLKPFLAAENPLDIATDHFAPDHHQEALFGAFLSDSSKAFDLALQCMSFPAADTWEDESWYRSAGKFCKVAKTLGLPSAFIAPTHEGLPRQAREMLIAQGSAPLQGFDDGMKAIAHACEWFESRRRMETGTVKVLSPKDVSSGISPTLFDEMESKSILAQHGIVVPDGIRWNPGGRISQDIEFPVALKALDPPLLHKSDIGGVSLNVESTEALVMKADRMSAALEKGGVRCKAFLVESMIRDRGVELLVGIRRVPEVGYCLVLASGGVLANLIGDARTVVLPASRQEIRDALSALRIFPMLEGWRGGPGVDIASAVEGILSACRIAESMEGALAELEINPFLLRGNQAPIALDAVIRINRNL